MPDFTLPHHAPVRKDHRDSKVVLIVKLFVGVDIAKLGIDAERAQRSQGVVTEMTALSRDQHDFHSWRLPEAGYAGRRSVFPASIIGLFSPLARSMSATRDLMSSDG